MLDLGPRRCRMSLHLGCGDLTLFRNLGHVDWSIVLHVKLLDVWRREPAPDAAPVAEPRELLRHRQRQLKLSLSLRRERSPREIRT